MHLAAQAFVIFTEELAAINIRSVARKSHILVAAVRVTQLPDNIDPQVQMHKDSIPILGTALGDEEFIGNFLRERLQRAGQLLRK